MKKLLSSLVMTILLSSCAVEKKNLQKILVNMFHQILTILILKNTVITNKNFDETWTSIIGFVSDSLFKIEKSEKDSGLLTLSFGAKEAEKFIDCGDFEYTFLYWRRI